MRRRAVLVGLGAVWSAGCLSSGQPSVSTPENVAEVSFELIDDGPDRGPPLIALDGSTVEITGTMYAGNPCYEATLRSVEYEEPSETLSVIVGVNESSEHPDSNLFGRIFGGSCPDSLGEDSYRIIVRFPSAAERPASIRATHHPRPGEPQTTLQ